ncbi:hypothetical protein BBJ28_00008761 [Nothophytophthora sp. Chile5]|nr:hypothetical protein BBJ28_00008761 [Nothophytophthora sp. Chile5]
MRSENAGVLDAMSDVSDSSVDSDSDVELLHVLDPSDPRAHQAAHKPLAVQPTREVRKAEKVAAAGNGGSRWDSDGPDPADDDDEDVGERVTIVIDDDDDDDDEQQTPQQRRLPEETATEPKKTAVTLSKWAQARFLVPASERKLPVLEDPPLEPLNDFILSDFGSRFRGETGAVEVEKQVEVDGVDDGEEQEATDTSMKVGAPLFDEAADGEKDERKEKKKSIGEPRKRRENRYFVTDLATKCFNCGQIGHMASVCTNKRLQKPCYYCALLGHQAWECPNLPCHYCQQLGHLARDCSNRRLEREPCDICGHTGHENEDCENVGRRDVTCMVCTEVGHLHCVPVPPPADRRVYCPHCAGNHALQDCRSYVEPPPSNFSTRSGGRGVQKCFVCQEAGHLAAECPSRSNGYGGGNCFKCGGRGHYAADCRSSGNSNGRRVSGRKRGRDVDEEYPDYNGYDYDDEEDNYVHGSSSSKKSRSRGKSSSGNNERSRRSSNHQSSAYPRLNEALPTRPYRNSNSSNGDGERKRQRRR